MVIEKREYTVDLVPFDVLLIYGRFGRFEKREFDLITIDLYFSYTHSEVVSILSFSILIKTHWGSLIQ